MEIVVLVIPCFVVLCCFRDFSSKPTLFLTSAAAGFSVMAMDTSPVLEPFCTGPNGEPKNTDEGSVLTSRNLTSEPRK